jgi:hypothetical protein
MAGGVAKVLERLHSKHEAEFKLRGCKKKKCCWRVIETNTGQHLLSVFMLFNSFNLSNYPKPGSNRMAEWGFESRSFYLQRPCSVEALWDVMSVHFEGKLPKHCYLICFDFQVKQELSSVVCPWTQHTKPCSYDIFPPQESYTGYHKCQVGTNYILQNQFPSFELKITS